MHQGRADQIGAPAEIYNHPATRFVADFVGHLNTFDAQVVDGNRISFAGRHVPGLDSRRLLDSRAAGGPVTVALRPEAMSLRRRDERDVTISGRLLHTDFMGSVIRARLDVAGQTVSIDMFNQNGLSLPEPGAEAELFFSPDDLMVLAE
jgi:putative spermidine/putrescine transport system ATP-binding protein